ncbi:MAG: zf-TFIIB domain-containing protein [Bacteriovoracaceae bacterium]|jgi:Zn-finger nucleic acid-binding protein|nr:zf-TFIIB domain-containing protein [Bacteriovoracaceae bacterium]
MKCPKCSDNEMHVFNHQGIEFNICSPGCKGIWCDKGELAYYVETKNDTPRAQKRDESGCGTEFNCPVCETTKLKEYPYMDGEELLIDICPSCKGIFLDFKELAEVEKLSIKIDSEGKLQRTLNDLMERAGYKKT